MFSIKSIVFYLTLILLTIFANHTYYYLMDSEFIEELEGDFTVLGVSENSPVIAYTATWCDACTKLKEYLSKNNILYDNVDIDEDIDALVRLRKLGLNNVPVIVIENFLIQGFNESLLDKHLTKKQNDQSQFK